MDVDVPLGNVRYSSVERLLFCVQFTIDSQMTVANHAEYEWLRSFLDCSLRLAEHRQRLSEPTVPSDGMGSASSTFKMRDLAKVRGD